MHPERAQRRPQAVQPKARALRIATDCRHKCRGCCFPFIHPSGRSAFSNNRPTSRTTSPRCTLGIDLKYGYCVGTPSERTASSAVRNAFKHSSFPPKELAVKTAELGVPIGSSQCDGDHIAPRWCRADPLIVAPVLQPCQLGTEESRE